MLRGCRLYIPSNSLRFRIRLYIPTTVFHGFWLMILTESSSKLLAYYEMEHGTFIILPPVSIISLKKRKRGTYLGKEGLLRTTIRIPYIFAICCVNTKQSSFNWFHAFTNWGMRVNQEFIPKIEFLRYNYDSRVVLLNYNLFLSIFFIWLRNCVIEFYLRPIKCKQRSASRSVKTEI